VSAKREAALLAALAAAASLQWGCASNAPKDTRGGSATTVPPGVPSAHADRGNPPFYDVLGHRYYVLATSEGYHARGLASWYGRDFQGLATSSGETYNMHAMTAAHKTLPIPTWVEVTNLENGKRVVVKVNDRGPFVADRLIDLSYAAALELDMVRDGTARVEVRALGAAGRPAPPVSSATAAAPAGASVTPAPQPAALPPPPPAAQAEIALISSAEAAEPPAATAGEQALYAQVGAFSDRANAARLVERLKSNGFAAAFIVSDADGRRTLHRVRLGPLRDEPEFDQVRARLRSLGFGESQLVTAR
jgi:rare lipoprotein A